MSIFLCFLALENTIVWHHSVISLLIDDSHFFEDVVVDCSDIAEDNLHGTAEKGAFNDDIIYLANGEDIDDDSGDEFIEYDDVYDLSKNLGGNKIKIDRDRRS